MSEDRQAEIAANWIRSEESIAAAKALTASTSCSAVPCRSERPALRERLHLGLMLWPIMKSGRVKVCATRPYQRMYFRIDPDVLEQRAVSQWAKELALENGFQIDLLLAAIVESDTQIVPVEDFHGSYSIDWVDHRLHVQELLREHLRVGKAQVVEYVSSRLLPKFQKLKRSTYPLGDLGFQYSSIGSPSYA